MTRKYSVLVFEQTNSIEVELENLLVQESTMASSYDRPPPPGMDWTKIEQIWWSAIAKKPTTDLAAEEFKKLLSKLVMEGKGAEHEDGIDHYETIPEHQRAVMLPSVPNVGLGFFGVHILGRFGGWDFSTR